MIKAEEAKELYQEVQLKADTFIENTIEPMIKQTAQTEQFIVLKYIQGWYQGNWFDGMNDDVDRLEIYDYVIGQLEKAGYKVKEDLERAGSEYTNGYGYLTIDWS